MTQQNAIKIFEEKKVRTVWDSETEEWYFSIVDVIAVLTDSPNPRKYWSVLKNRLKKEGSELTTNCSQLKMLFFQRTAYQPERDRQGTNLSYRYIIPDCINTEHSREDEYTDPDKYESSQS